MIDAREKERIIEELFAENSHWLGVISRNNAPGDSRQDLAQEIRIALWKSLDQYDGASSSIGTWFYSVARNTAREFKRKNHNSRKRDERVYPSLDFVEQEHDPLRVTEDFIETLGERDRQVFSMFIENLTYAEMSAATGADEANLRKRISRIKERFKQIYGS